MKRTRTSYAVVLALLLAVPALAQTQTGATSTRPNSGSLTSPTPSGTSNTTGTTGTTGTMNNSTNGTYNSGGSTNPNGTINSGGTTPSNPYDISDVNGTGTAGSTNRGLPATDSPMGYLAIGGAAALFGGLWLTQRHRARGQVPW